MSLPLLVVAAVDHLHPGGTIPPDALRTDGYSGDMTQRLCSGDNSAFVVTIFEM